MVTGGAGTKKKTHFKPVFTRIEYSIKNDTHNILKFYKRHSNIGHLSCNFSSFIFPFYIERFQRSVMEQIQSFNKIGYYK